MKWTPEANAELTRLAALGHSGAKIAGAMGLTKGQVSGQAHRLGVSLKGSLTTRTFTGAWYANDEAHDFLTEGL